MFPKAKANQLLELIEELVASDGAWKDKKAKLLENASDDQVTALAEVSSWFDDDKPEGEPNAA